MKPLFFLSALAGVLVFQPAGLFAQTNATVSAPAGTVVAPATMDREKATLEKHLRPVLTALNLDDAAKEARVREIVTTQFQALDAWHAQNDTQIKEQWNQFNKSRSKLDEAGADAALAKIDGIYATFQPQHADFLAKLGTVLTPAQIETVEDALTINKVKITFNAYGQIFHGLTDEQKAFILKNLKAAREQAIDAGAMTEKSAFFKKYKIQIEAYLTAQGYDVKQSYKDFVAKQKAEMAAKKSDAPSTNTDQQ